MLSERGERFLFPFLGVRSRLVILFVCPLGDAPIARSRYRLPSSRVASFGGERRARRLFCLRLSASSGAEDEAGTEKR